VYVVKFVGSVDSQIAQHSSRHLSFTVKCGVIPQVNLAGSHLEDAEGMALPSQLDTEMPRRLQAPLPLQIPPPPPLLSERGHLTSQTTDANAHEATIKLRGLPYSAGVAEITEWLSGLLSNRPTDGYMQ